PWKVRRFGSAPFAAIEQVRRWVGSATAERTGRGGAVVGFGLDDGTTTEEAEDDPAAIPAKTEPVPSSTNATASAEISQVLGCCEMTAKIPARAVSWSAFAAGDFACGMSSVA
ncbi:MAG: hypothetical protein JWO18_1774, partial [Microbacteriaceae bacterium]|nr:hypothetical protein [Microbacteriaceae bacterium]